MQKIPIAAADRILRNPHGLPHVPTVLTEYVGRSQRTDRALDRAEQAHLERRERLNSVRSDRIMLERRQSMEDESAVSDTEAEPVAPLRPRSRSVGMSHQHHAGSPISHRFRRNSMSAEERNGMLYSPSYSHFGPRRHSMVERELHLLPRMGMFFSADDTDASLLELSRSSATNGNTFQGRRSFYTDPLYSNIYTPQERARQRCHLLKKPHPSLSNTTASRVATINSWQPGWHRLMRKDYVKQGKDSLWRQERSLFLQESRRERQFQRQTKRRMSFS